MEEHLDVSVELLLLFGLDDCLDLPLLLYVDSLVFHPVGELLVELLLDLILENPEVLGSLANVLSHPDLHFLEVLLIDLSGLVVGQTQLVLGWKILVFLHRHGFHIYLLPIKLFLLVFVLDRHVDEVVI